MRFGYINIEEKERRFLGNDETIRGHEFHYFDSTDNGVSCIVTKPVSGSSWDAVKAGPVSWMGFPHIYYPAEPGFADEFVKKMKVYSAKS